MLTWLASLPSLRPPKKVAAHPRGFLWWVTAASRRTEDRLGSSALWTQKRVVRGYRWCGTTDLWLAQFLKLWKEKFRSKSYYKELKHSVLLLFFSKNHRVQSQNHWVGKDLQDRVQPVNWSLPCQPDQSTEFYIWLFPEHLHGWGCHHILGQPLPMLNHHFVFISS